MTGPWKGASEGAVPDQCPSLSSLLLQGTRGIIWDHDIYENMQYNQDRRFFHTFEGDQFLIAFSFAEEREADDFFKKVHGRSKYGK